MRQLTTGILLAWLCMGASAQERGLQVTPLTTDFYIYTTYQEINGTAFPANGLYVLTSDGAILVDTPWDLPSLQQFHTIYCYCRPFTAI